MTAAQVVLLALGAVLFIVSQAVTVAIGREYDGWAFALARLWVRVAGCICGSRRKQWLADVLYIQREERRAALYESFLHMLEAPILTLSDMATRIGSRRASPTQDTESFLLTEEGDFLVTEAGDRILLESHIVGSADVRATLHVTSTSHGVGGSEMSNRR